MQIYIKIYKILGIICKFAQYSQVNNICGLTKIIDLVFRKLTNINQHIYQKTIDIVFVPINFMKHFRQLFAVIIVFLGSNTFGQSLLTPLSDEYAHLIERYEIKSGSLASFHSNVKPIRRKDLVELSLKLENSSQIKLSKADKFNLKYLQNDSWEYLDSVKSLQNFTKKPLAKHLFKVKSDFYQSRSKDFDLHISPLFQFGITQDNNLQEMPLINTRGIEIRGTIGSKLGFYTMMSDNQVTFPEYVREYSRRYDANPYEAFTKIMGDDSIRRATDFISARGYIIFKPIKNIQIQFGHDKNFIGSGIRSMILSDFSPAYLHLKITTQIGRVQYMNIYAQTANRQIPLAINNTELIPPKYFSMQHLSINVNKNLNLGLFETIVFGKRPIGFDLNYLNPVIFLRYVEGNLGSVDNSILGGNFKYNFKKHYSIYGQLVLDEFNISQFKRDGWWGKKYATQLGGRYIDAFGVKNLDLQLEYNMARPFTYSHSSSYSNYVNYNLPLAHPLGANFKEFLFLARYQPIDRLSLNFTLLDAVHGKDDSIINWGGNIKRNYNLYRPYDFGNEIGQGRTEYIRSYQLSASVMMAHNLFLDLKFQKRDLALSGIKSEFINNMFSIGVRWNSILKSYTF